MKRFTMNCLKIAGHSQRGLIAEEDHIGTDAVRTVLIRDQSKGLRGFPRRPMHIQENRRR